MGFRTVVIKQRSKLDLRMNYLVCRNEEETKIYIPEISYVILESTSISLTTALLSELIKNNVKIIFCDEHHNPESELVGLYQHYNCVKHIQKQFQWKDYTKGKVWAEIVKNKIAQQANLLACANCPQEAKMLRAYCTQVENNDITNREGHAAKVYFNALFGKEFQRRDQAFTNKVLNYGYAILLSMFNREIVRQGYLTQIGIWHKNEFNYFNLSSDIMEPFRAIVDKAALTIQPEDISFKIKMLEICNMQVKIDGKMQYLENAISTYCQSVMQALNSNDIKCIKFYEM